MEFGAHCIVDTTGDIAAFTRLPHDPGRDSAMRAARCQAGGA